MAERRIVAVNGKFLLERRGIFGGWTQETDLLPGGLETYKTFDSPEELVSHHRSELPSGTILPVIPAVLV